MISTKQQEEQKIASRQKTKMLIKRWNNRHHKCIWCKEDFLAEENLVCPYCGYINKKT